LPPNRQQPFFVTKTNIYFEKKRATAPLLQKSVGLSLLQNQVLSAVCGIS